LATMDYNERMKFFSDGDEYQDLYLLFARARYLTFRAREKELQRYGLTPEQAQVLFLAQALGNKATPAEISRMLLRQPHTVSAMVNRMKANGLIKKVKDLDRKNLIRVTLTEKGVEAYKLTTKRGPIRRILGELNEEERKVFHQYLERIMYKAREELGMDRDDLPPSE
jgi:DNA-binding MarR family transcriptional regulator